MINRNVEKNIEKYLFSQNKKALLVNGARQVGKTFIIRELLKKHNLDYVEINFIENKKSVFNISQFEGKRISLPYSEELYPSLENIAKHRKKHLF